MRLSDRMVLEHLAFPLNGRTRKEIMARTGMTNASTVSHSLVRLREAGLLEGWDVTESGRREITPQSTLRYFLGSRP